MNVIQKTSISAVAGTSAMTMFSFMASRLEKENFREPALLGTFINNTFKTGAKFSKPLGWVLHYVVGVGFTAVYKWTLRSSKVEPSLGNGLCYGAFAGITGILFWETLFSSRPGTAHTNRPAFYSQLFLAHLIFGAVIAAMDKKLNELQKT
ncbi:hypothetical protein LZD49_04045 [Dyadobacter sp. CY261]|uniref:hypothetical protein n=1 Tax=Dyadobacter sp. CY261 TaxID=2907203 RepID=UPI001F3724A7|nr:hypothetical protein [Dyadobacter sp. CY261]MCF0069629.1 hypothetical protein [Dyadobacter sp. CY261]